ncbi:hypothetical protein IJ843_08655 [bacterium]|nr:hypothetical protein [bacterium]
MAELSGLQVFKYLPASKKAENSNCKKCGFPTCMSYALKLAKGQSDIELCPYAPEELKTLISHTLKKAQNEVQLGFERKTPVGGEEVLFRHDRTFLAPTALCVVIDTDSDYKDKLEKVLSFEISRINETFKIDVILLKGSKVNSELINSIENQGISVITEIPSNLKEIKEENFEKTVETLTLTRRTAIQTKNENFAAPVFVYFEHQKDLYDLCAKASFYLCKYANMLVFEDFCEEMFASLITLRQNIFTDPQKPLQIEPKVYAFNNPDENAIIFLTTNFALTYFAVANELEALNIGTYLIVTPSEGMSVLTAWSAEKFTAKIVAKAVQKSGLYDKVKTKKIYIPGLLAHMQQELQTEIHDFEICIGTTEAYLIKDFVKNLKTC